MAADVWISAKYLAQQGEGGGILFGDNRGAGKDFAHQEHHVFVAVAKKTVVTYFMNLWGRTCIRKRRMNSEAGSVMTFHLLPSL